MSAQRVFLLVAVLLGGFLVNASPAQQRTLSGSEWELAWSLDGYWTGVVGDDSKGIIYANSRGKWVELDLAGKKQREVKFADNVAYMAGASLRTATLRGDRGKAILAFQGWGSRDLRAYDVNGKPLWTYPLSDGIDDVCTCDLDGDGSDEVIIGFNGSSGLHVLDGMGKLLWKSTEIRNVWHVCAGDVLGDGKRQVVATSASGKVHVFDARGSRMSELDPGHYATMVRVAIPSEKDKPAMILASNRVAVPGREHDAYILTAMSGKGDKKWWLELPSNSAPGESSAQSAPGKPWLAVGMSGGQVYVIDIEKGAIIAGASDQGTYPEVAWAKSNEPDAPLLLVATHELNGRLSAFRIAKGATPKSIPRRRPPR